MYGFYSTVALVYFVVATVMLMLLAFLLLAGAGWTVLSSVMAGDPIDGLLDSVGLMIIGFAVIETSKFIAEEEIVRKRELRSAMESRRSLTKFITIVVIAASLEALVMVFRTGREDIALTIYPAVLFAAAMIALVALGAYQWLSSRIEPASEREKIDAEEASADIKAAEDGSR